MWRVAPAMPYGALPALATVEARARATNPDWPPDRRAESELPRDRVEPHERLIVAINPAKLVRGIDFPPDQAELVQRIDRRVAVCFRYC